MIICKMPDEIPNLETFTLIYPRASPVIAIVDVTLLAGEVSKMRRDLPRLGHNYARLFSSTPVWLGLPIIEMRGNILRFSQGRHRSMVYSMEGYTHFPVLTTSEDIQSLLDGFGLDLAGAEAIYEFSHLPEIPIVGK